MIGMGRVVCGKGKGAPFLLAFLFVFCYKELNPGPRAYYVYKHSTSELPYQPQVLFSLMTQTYTQVENVFLFV